MKPKSIKREKRKGGARYFRSDRERRMGEKYKGGDEVCRTEGLSLGQKKGLVMREQCSREIGSEIQQKREGGMFARICKMTEEKHNGKREGGSNQTFMPTDYGIGGQLGGDRKIW